jgi:hypothetical protein
MQEEAQMATVRTNQYPQKNFQVQFDPMSEEQPNFSKQISEPI